MISLSIADGGRIVLIDMLNASESVPIDDIYRNVYRLDQSGAEIWRIGDYVAFQNSTFTNIYFDESGQLKGYNFDGCEYAIDLLTGSVERGSLLK